MNGNSWTRAAVMLLQSLYFSCFLPNLPRPLTTFWHSCKKAACNAKRSISTILEDCLRNFLQINFLMMSHYANEVKGQVIWATFLHNLSRNIVALQVEKRCCPYYHPRSQLVTQQISMLQLWQGSKLRPRRSHLRLNFSYLRLEKRE